MELREILSRCDHTLLRVDATAAEIRALWQDDIKAFRARREPYLLYPEK